MPDVELYWGPGSCARVPFIALEEAGADFTLHVINRFAGDAKSPEYLAINPKGKVPTLVVDGWILTENPAIQTYIAGAYPDAGLLPTGDERTGLQALSTMAWFASGMHPHVGRLRFRATGSGMDGTPFPRCADHALRNEERPAVARVLDREELEFSRFVEAGTVPDDI